MPSNRLEIFPFSNINGALSDLAFNIQNQHHGASPRLAPLQNTLTHIGNLGCKTIIKQHDVQDPDFLAEYYAYYSRVFGKTPKYCHRLHFFSKEMGANEDVLDFIDRAATGSDSYLGFITVRPVRSSPVAATILRPLPNQRFLLSLDSFDVHLAGRQFHVCGTPYIQQDNAVGACAQASIWMALRTLRKKEGNSAIDPAQITSAATRFLVRGRTLPNREGLAVDQIIEAVRSSGYSPQIMQFSAVGHLTGSALLNAKRKVYTYVESGIPVVLGIFPNPSAGHAIVAIGHTWNQCTAVSPYATGTGVNFYNAADWVCSFIVHNDNTAPYIELPETATDGYSFEQVRNAIPLLPSDVFMTGEEAERVAVTILTNLLQLQIPPNAADGTKPQTLNLVTRTYLLERFKFRDWITNNTNINNDVKKYYRLKSLPKRIWVTEICLLEQYNGVSSGSLARVGEVLIDPTGEPNDGPFLSVHLNISAIYTAHTGTPQGVIIDRSADGAEITYIPINVDTCYSPLCR
ncbi:MAG: C39 family peptidase [Gallionellaceae bacterium]|jgi:hypothetical protein